MEYPFQKTAGNQPALRVRTIKQLMISCQERFPGFQSPEQGPDPFVLRQTAIALYHITCKHGQIHIMLVIDILKGFLFIMHLIQTGRFIHYRFAGIMDITEDNQPFILPILSCHTFPCTGHKK